MKIEDYEFIDDYVYDGIWDDECNMDNDLNDKDTSYLYNTDVIPRFLSEKTQIYHIQNRCFINFKDFWFDYNYIQNTIGKINNCIADNLNIEFPTRNGGSLSFDITVLNEFDFNNLKTVLMSFETKGEVIVNEFDPCGINVCTYNFFNAVLNSWHLDIIIDKDSSIVGKGYIEFYFDWMTRK